MKDLSCPKCDSNKIIPGLKILDYGHGNVKKHLTLDTKIKTKLFGKTKVEDSSEILTNVCGNCGHLELYVNNYKKLWETYKKQD